MNAAQRSCWLAVAALLALPAWAHGPATSARNLDKKVEISAGNVHEECFDLRLGARIRYDFRANRPLDFNLHAHDGDGIATPVKRAGVRSLKGTYTTNKSRGYCLQWSNPGSGSATLHYRINIGTK